jgi:hypothetical protein
MDPHDVETREIKTNILRGISARACVTKAMTWELKSAKDATVHDASGIETSLPQAPCKAKQTPK